MNAFGHATRELRYPAWCTKQELLNHPQSDDTQYHYRPDMRSRRDLVGLETVTLPQSSGAEYVRYDTSSFSRGKASHEKSEGREQRSSDAQNLGLCAVLFHSDDAQLVHTHFFRLPM
jgi:hypothetical protein